MLVESCYEVWVEWWLAAGVAAGGFGAGFVRLFDSQDVVQLPIGVLRPRVLCDEQQNAPVRGFEDGQEPPRGVEVEPADAGYGCAG
jgi:hypothetical protein